MSKPYLIDGKEADAHEVIQRAQGLGYQSQDGFYSTSEAARVLRGHGLRVEENRGEP